MTEALFALMNQPESPIHQINSSKRNRRQKRHIVNRRLISDRRYDNERDHMKSRVEKKAFKGKRYIFRQHDVGDFAYIVESGIVEVVKRVDGKMVVLSRIGPGGMFGEMALVDNAPRIASAKTIGPVIVSVITRDVLARKIAVINPFARGLIAALSGHVRNISAQLDSTVS